MAQQQQKKQQQQEEEETKFGRLVQLEWYEVVIASQIGTLRYAQSLHNKRHRNMYSSTTKDPLVVDIHAAGAEVAVAKSYGDYWLGGVNVHGLPDVAPDIEVRHTLLINGNLRLRVYEAHNDRPYVLVKGIIPDYRIIGFMFGRDAVRDEWRKNPNDEGEIFLVPVAHLHPPRGLEGRKRAGDGEELEGPRESSGY